MAQKYTIDTDSALAPCLSCVGKVFIVTGANVGIGYHTAKHLALLGGHVVLGCRSNAKAAAAICQIKTECAMTMTQGSVSYLPLDLSSMESVQRFQVSFQQRHARLDAIVCSAGINSDSGGPDADVFFVNFTAHFLLVTLLMDLLRKTGTPTSPSRVITLSSAMHVTIPSLRDAAGNGPTVRWDDASSLSSYSMSKLGLHLLANHITSNGSSIVVGVAVNPGAVNSSIWRGSNSIVQWIARHVFLTSEQGSYPSVYAAVSPTIVVATRENKRKENKRKENKRPLYVTPYIPVCGVCIRRAPFSWCRRWLVLLSNVGEAVFGRCLYGRARFGETSAVAMDEFEAERLFMFAAEEVARRERCKQ